MNIAGILQTFVAAVLLAACQTSSKSALTGYPQTLGATPFLTGGFNHAPVFSGDEDKVFFLSKTRRDHRNHQVYEYDHSIRTQRRITFQDGDVFSVANGPAQSILYSSNTDEIKETPFVQDQDPRFPRAEIYHSDVYGNEIERVTENPGFDGDMVFVESKNQILLTSVQSGVAGLYWMDLQQKTKTAFQVGKNHQRSPSLSPDGKTVFWIEEESAKKQSIVKASIDGGERTIVTTEAGVIKSLTVNASGMIAYAWLPKREDHSQINLLNPETNCNRVILKSDMDFLDPRFSVKYPNVLLFSGTLKENSVIYRWELPETLGPCVR